MISSENGDLTGIEVLNRGLAWTIVMECLIMATECALSKNSGNRTLIAAGGITVFWILA